MVLGNPLISIVMCTYNRAPFIAETIKSIQAQTFTNWELLIMDNGSTDDTEAVIKGINDPRITAIKVEPQNGYYWDNKHGNAVAFAKTVVGAILGKTLDDSIEGKLVNP